MAMEFKLPDLGENIESGDVINILVAVGDRIDKQQPILELETDKAVVEVPSSVAGVVREIHVKAGEKAAVGQLILTVDGAAPAKAQEEKAASPKEAEPESPAPVPSAPSREEPAPASAQPAPQPVPAGQEAAAAASSRRAEVVNFQQKARSREDGAAPVAAAPSVRRFAREIGVDIAQVEGTGPQGRISREDVKTYARNRNAGAAPGGLPGVAGVQLPDFSRWGEVRREKFSNVRRATAAHLTRCWLTVPHVTQNDQCDVTELEERRKRYASRVEKEGGKLTVTGIVVKVLAGALRVFPQFNASIDVQREEIILKEYVNIGVAVDTPRGLLVPVLRDVDRKNIVQLSVELQEMATKAREGKVPPELLQGGTFTVTNLGGIGGTSFSPIVNWPEVAILGLSRSRVEPVYQEGQFVPRTLLPLSLSYDHRLIDGANAARFLRWVASALEDPFLLALEG